MKIISIGSSCEVGFFIKKNFNSEYYIFDWMYSNIDFIIKTFESDYFEFTECEKLNPVWDPPYPHTYIFNNNCKGEKERICSAVTVHDADNHTQKQYISKIPIINEKYKRRFKSHKKYKADDQAQQYHIGDKVVIEETNPISKDKKWKVLSKI